MASSACPTPGAQPPVRPLWIYVPSNAGEGACSASASCGSLLKRLFGFNLVSGKQKVCCQTLHKASAFDSCGCSPGVNAGTLLNSPAFCASVPGLRSLFRKRLQVTCSLPGNILVMVFSREGASSLDGRSLYRRQWRLCPAEIHTSSLMMSTWSPLSLCSQLSNARRSTNI